MPLSTGWVILIVVLVFAIIISNITLLKKSNKGFDFPDSYEKDKKIDKNDSEKKPNDDEPSGLL